jgi:hypothetical protein
LVALLAAHVSAEACSTFDITWNTNGGTVSPVSCTVALLPGKTYTFSMCSVNIPGVTTSSGSPIIRLYDASSGGNLVASGASTCSNGGQQFDYTVPCPDPTIQYKSNYYLRQVPLA